MATIANDISAIQPEIWSAMVQAPLYKSLVAMEVCNTKLQADLKNGDTIHVPRFTDLSAYVYTPGTDLTAQSQEWDFDNLIVSTYKATIFYVDDVRKLTLNVDQARELATNSAFQLRDKIDAFVFSKMKNAHALTKGGGFFAMDNEAALAGTRGRPVSAGSANIINIFGATREKLRTFNVEENVPWCAVISPKVAKAIELKSTTVGFNVADSTLRNGYIGDFMGYEIYISNNLPTGSASAVACISTVYEETTTEWGGCSGGAVSATTVQLQYFGQKGTIDLVMLAEPQLVIKDEPNKLGKNFITYTLYGANLGEKNRKRAVMVPVQSGFY